MVFPKRQGVSWIACIRNRLLERPYSFTNCFSDLPERLLSSFCPFLERNHLLSGIWNQRTDSHADQTYGQESKERKRLKPGEVNIFCLSKVGRVPISVIMPPILLAKANGISNRLGFILALIARLTTMGSIHATVPVLLTKRTTIQGSYQHNKQEQADFTVSSKFKNTRTNHFLPVLSEKWPAPTNSPIIIMTTELRNRKGASSVLISER